MSLLSFLGRAVVRNSLRALVSAVPLGEALLDIASDLWEALRRGKPEELPAEVEALAQAPPAEVRRQAVAVAEEAAASQPPEVRLALVSYLTQVPAMIRRSLRRPSDPTGTTVPRRLSLARPDDLLMLLPPRLPRFKAGDRPLAGRPWVLEELLGIGGFGEVWKAADAERSGATAALKFCLDDRAAKSLQHEAATLERVLRHGHHPGIVPLRGVYLENDPVCLEYEYVPGGDLGSAIREAYLAGRLTPDLAVHWLRELAAVVAFPHQMTPPLVHRDLKPANVLVPPTPDGSFRPRVIDFGISEVAATRALGEATRAATGRSAVQATVVRGAYTPLYASPQQMRGDGADPRDDVHALGVIWHQMLTGDLTRGRPSGRGWRRPLGERGMPAELLDLLEVCTDDDPHERPADAGDLVRRLDALLLAGRVVARLSTVRNELGMVLVRLPPGSFRMGSPDSEAGRADDERPHQVEISRPFLLAAHLVTQEQYQRVMGGHDPSAFADGRIGGPAVRGMDTLRFPVDSVTHEEAVEFCRRLSELSEERAAGRVYRLLTEAEWEYACRAGTDGPFAFGAALASTRANFDGHYPYGDAGQAAFLQRTTEVGAYPANAWGLYDLHGNVWEWCADWYGPYPGPGSLSRDPAGPSGGVVRVLRGGSWYNSAGSCRSATRNKQPPGQRVRNNGFRVACDVAPG